MATSTGSHLRTSRPLIGVSTGGLRVGPAAIAFPIKVAVEEASVISGHEDLPGPVLTESLCWSQRQFYFPPLQILPERASGGGTTDRWGPLPLLASASSLFLWYIMSFILSHLCCLGYMARLLICC